jgi:hypothetical protein
MTSVVELARQFGVHKVRVFKVMKRLKITATMERGDSRSRGQAVAFVGEEDAVRLLEHFRANAGSSASSGVAPAPDEAGVFYVIALEPSLDPGRLKVGFASNMSERLRQHRCAAPFAKVLGKWPSRLLWEKTAIDAVTQGCERLHTEVFRTDDVEGLLRRCEALFALMPKP